MWKVIIIGFASVLAVNCQIIDTNEAHPSNFQVPTIPDSMYLKVAEYRATVDEFNNIEIGRNGRTY